MAAITRPVPVPVLSAQRSVVSPQLGRRGLAVPPPAATGPRLWSSPVRGRSPPPVASSSVRVTGGLQRTSGPRAVVCRQQSVPVPQLAADVSATAEAPAVGRRPLSPFDAVVGFPSAQKAGAVSPLHVDFNDVERTRHSSEDLPTSRPLVDETWRPLGDVSHAHLWDLRGSLEQTLAAAAARLREELTEVEARTTRRCEDLCRDLEVERQCRSVLEKEFKRTMYEADDRLDLAVVNLEAQHGALVEEVRESLDGRAAELVARLDSVECRLAERLSAALGAIAQVTAGHQRAVPAEGGADAAQWEAKLADLRASAKRQAAEAQELRLELADQADAAGQRLEKLVDEVFP